MDLSSLFWRGKKTYEFHMSAPGPKDPCLREMTSMFDRSGIALTVEELSREEALCLMEHDVKIAKASIYGLKAEGRTVPEDLIRASGRASSLCESIRDGRMRLYVVKVLIDAGYLKREDVYK